MRPYDALTDEDIKTIQYYLEIYGATRSAPLPQVLSVWNKNKTTLFKALGNKLRVERQISIPKNISVMRKQLSTIYHEYVLWGERALNIAKNDTETLNLRTNNSFISSVMNYWANQNYTKYELYNLSKLFNYENVSLGYIETISEPGEFTFTSFKGSIKNGMKTIRTIQRMLHLTHYPDMASFDEWRNAVNCLSIENEIQTKLVLSIHPIDFMSMSDNTCNWSSCMSWSHNGCYRSGTLEMMNSNLAIVAYLEGPQSFKLNINENEVYNIPNKSWRSLFYVHKNILLSGKAYPYHNEDLIFKILDILKELVKKNLNWDYQFGIQEYKDMKNLDGNFYMRDFFNLEYDKKKNHHCIFVYTNCMYNDIIESHVPYYYCYRNYVPKSIKLCLSGPPTCICCGKPIAGRENIYDYADVGSDLICGDCRYDRQCCECGITSYHIKYRTNFGKFCSDECCSNQIYFPKFNRALSREDIVPKDYSKTIVFTTGLSWKRAEEIKNNYPNSWDSSDQDVLNYITQLKKEYGSKVIIKRVSEKMGGVNFLNLRRYTPDFYSYHYSRVGDIMIFQYNGNHAHDQRTEQIRQKIDDLGERMSLLEYLKGGSN